MNRIRTWWLHRRHQEACDVWAGVRRDEQRRCQERADSKGNAHVAAERVPQVVADVWQQDTAALRMDRWLCATGQMTIARFRELHPGLFPEESPILNLDPEPVRPEPRFCHHPDAVTVTGPLRGVTEVSCPACPARAYAQWPAVPTLLPWLLPTTGTTPPDCNGGA